MQLLISDANILIDLEEGGVLESLFDLPFKFLTPDILYYEELEDHHEHLLQLGLALGSLDGDGIADVEIAAAKYTGPSRNDCMALVMARLEGCPLLTGDRYLRRAAESEGVVVMGTIWLVQQLLEHGLVAKERAEHAFTSMEEAGRRLPWELAKAMLDNFE